MIARRLTILAAAVAFAAASAWFALELANSYLHLFSILGVTP